MNRYLQIVLGCSLTLTILYLGRSIFIPLSFSLLIACILYPLCHALEKRGVPSVLSITISMSGLILFAAGLIWLLVWQISGFASEWGQLQSKLIETWSQFSLWLTNSLHISPEKQLEWLNSVEKGYGNDVLPILKSTIGNVSVLVVLLILIPIIAALILFERRRLVKVLHSMLPNVPLAEMRTILAETIHAYYQFIKGMLIVYLCVGLLNSIGLLLLGVPHAILFGCIAAILTFIPYVGIMIGASLPIVVSWITFDSIYYPLGVVAIFTVVQYLEANVIFPWAVSSKLNVNTLVTIVAILAGGALWGSSGMILFIPFMGILKLVADRMPGWEPIALLLGGSDSKRLNKPSSSPSAPAHDVK